MRVLLNVPHRLMPVGKLLQIKIKELNFIAMVKLLGGLIRIISR